MLCLCGMYALAACAPPSPAVADPRAGDDGSSDHDDGSAGDEERLDRHCGDAGVDATGTKVVPSATVKNQGTVATPAGTILDVAFVVDGTTVWSDTKTTSLAAGASVTLTANGGENGTNYWTATAGNHALKATVNSVNRIAETDMTNNTLSKTITNTTPATTTTTPPTTTTTPPNPGARQPVLAWLGMVGMDNLLGNNAGGSPSTRWRRMRSMVR